MPRYTRESLDRVRDAVDFVELVSARTDLRRAGQNRYEGLCPFHEERTPSFGIDPGQKVYYCFGCQAAGDVFTFVQETEGVDFKGALELLADRCGIELEHEREDPREADRRRGHARLLELLARTSAYYERCLWESSEAARARAYLRERGLGEGMLREFHVGYAPSAWDRVLGASLRNGFREAELYATGLAQRSKQSGRPYDRFRARIMFPLADTRGRVLGFGARLVGEAREGQRGPKYLNTSDNTIYHKGLHLYGAHLARAHAARAGAMILCEGYTDVIALHQAGIRNTVGVMGTALTAEQVGELARMAPAVLLALDADSSGQEAMLRAAKLAAARKLELRVVALPNGTDPAELVQRDGPDAIKRAIESSLPFVRFRVERVLAAGDHSSAEGRDRMLEELRPVFAILGPSAMRLELTQLIAGRLALPASLTERMLAADAPTRARELAPDPAPASGEQQARAAARLSRREDTERAFLALCIASPKEGEAALADTDLEAHFTSELLRRAAARLRGHLHEPLLAADGQDSDAQLMALLAELIVKAGAEPANPTMLKVQSLQLELAHIDRQLQAALAPQPEGAPAKQKDSRPEGQPPGSSDSPRPAAGEISELAARRAEIKRDFERAYEHALRVGG